MLNDAEEEVEYYISLLEDSSATNCQFDPVPPLHWVEGPSDGASFQAANLFKSQSSLGDFFSFHSVYDWISLLWEAPSDFLQVLWKRGKY